MRLTMARLFLLLTGALIIIPACSDDGGSTVVVTTPDTNVFLRFMGRINTGRFDLGGAEIAAYDPGSKRLFSVSAGTGTDGVVEVFNLATLPTITNTPILTIPTSTLLGGTGASPNSVACKNGILAVAVQAGVKTDTGAVVFYNANDATFATPLATVPAGALPDMVTFTPDGTKVLVANEGEPSDDYTVDPEGSISIITLVAGVPQIPAQTATFTSFEPQKAALMAAGVRIYGIDLTGGPPGVLTTVAKDLEPEYIAVSADGLTAYVTLQENNAMAAVNIATATVTQIVPLGFKDWSLPSQQIDVRDSGAVISFVNLPVRGMYQPDAVATFVSGGQTFLVMANEGDVREWAGLSEIARLSAAGVTLDPVVFPNPGIGADLKDTAKFARLNITTKSGNTDGDADLEQIYSFGARSFSIRTAAGALVWDSGDAIEKLIADILPFQFNVSSTNNTMDNRSDDKGPEPEGLTVATIGTRTYAFVALERIGGILVYDITTPSAPVFQTYINTRDFGTAPLGAPTFVGAGLPVPGGDLGPEGVLFISATDSPTGKAMLVVSNEISGSISLFQIDQITN